MFKPTLTENISNKDRVAILGSSRGLGWSVYKELVSQFPEIQFFLSSRKILDRQAEISDRTRLYAQDFSKAPVQAHFFNLLREFKPTRLIYVAGGGPHGPFAKKKWTDHMWSLTTSFLYPAELLHLILSQIENWPDLQSVVFVGSQIAEANPDENAASYAASKHALKGLISTVQLENKSKPQVLLFSPGYMQTDLLPAESWPVQAGLAVNSGLVARQLIRFIEKNN